MEYTIHLFNAGCFVMYPLVLFMLAACTILFERIRTYRNINHELQQLSDSIDAGRNSNNWSTLENSIKNSDDALSRFVSPIVESVYSAEGLENRLHDVVGYMDERLKRGLNWLSMMVTMAPLLGLLGDCCWYDPLLRGRWWRYWCAYCYYRRRIRSAGCHCNRAFSSHRSISHP